MKLITFTFTLLCLTSFAIAQDPSPLPVEGRNKDKEKRRDRDRHEQPDSPDQSVDVIHVKPDAVSPNPAEPDEGESLTYPDGTDIESPEAIQGRVEREQRRKDREADLQRRHEQAEKERLAREAEEAANPKPKPLRGIGGLIGNAFWWIFGAALWPLQMVLTLVKWGGWLLLLFTVPLLLIVGSAYIAFVFLIGILCWWFIRWVYRLAFRRKNNTKKGE